jgi:hypothetical protein
MVYSNIVDASRTHFIMISPNYNENLQNIGTKINIKTWLPTDITDDNSAYQFSSTGKVFGEDNLSSEKFKNRVIFSSLINDDDKRPVTLLTQQNLFHNIKYIHKNDDFTQPRLLFIKYNVTNNVVNNNQYLFTPVDNKTNLSEVNLIDGSLNMFNTDNEIIAINDDTYKSLERLSYYYNFYKLFVNSDYYNFRFTDYVDLSYVLQNRTISEFNHNLLKVNAKTVSLENNFASNTMLNYDETNFKQLFHFQNENNNTKAEDVSYVITLPLIQNIDYDYDNILLHTKLDNISRIRLDLIYPDLSSASDIITGYSDICINFVVNKGYDYYSKLHGKLFLTNDFTYLNARVLNHNNDFYTTNAGKYDDNKVYLSLGNSITGITQHDLYTKMKLDIETIDTVTVTTSTKKIGDVKKIYFSKSVNSSNVATEIKDRTYLLEEEYDYDYVNILYNNIHESNIKNNIDLNLLDFYHDYSGDFSQNIYNHRFNSLGLLNNEISSNKFDVSYQSSNNNFFITDTTDISYNNIDYKLRLNNSSTSDTTLFGNPITNNLLNYDYRYNYNNTFYTDIFFTINYSYGTDINELSFNTLSQYSNTLLLNFHKIILTSQFNTLPGSDFTNVDCIFIYHDPYDDSSPDEFKYPFNNIEISNNPNIDTLSRAIVLLPNAFSSVTNSTIIPAKNGSNLSRKQIQGLVGWNNIPALLSVLPYDENTIIGRGFVNQYQITDECKTYTDKVEEKLNSQKHISVKNPVDNTINTDNVPKTRNFANLVRSRRRNQNISVAENCQIDPATIQNYTTPFTNPMWRRTR